MQSALFANILLDAFAAIGCVAVMAAVGLGLLAWAALSTDAAKALVGRYVPHRRGGPPLLDAAPPRPVPDDIKARARP